VGDDIRQDVLAIQVLTLLRQAFRRAALPLYLRPYGCLPTGYECGIIEVVPNCRSRASLGELSDRGLHDIVAAEHGAPGSAAFERARRAFISSEAAYAVASFLLQAKDRHNGNIMLDDEGHIVHIDFGFILEISPGGNLGFESAAFKLSHEMCQLLDPGGRQRSAQFALFEELVVRAYLAARTVREPIVAAVALMADSGLPCFGRGQPIANLRRRFHPEMSDAQAAAFMRGVVRDAYDKWTTGFYDYVQYMQHRYAF
jgi:phosphatidylinositol 4-kinase